MYILPSQQIDDPCTTTRHHHYQSADVLVRELTIHDLQNCDEKGGLLLCPSIGLLNTTTELSCLYSLYTNNVDMITALCYSDLLNKLTTHVFQVDHQRFLLYTPKIKRILKLFCLLGMLLSSTVESLTKSAISLAKMDLLDISTWNRHRLYRQIGIPPAILSSSHLLTI